MGSWRLASGGISGIWAEIWSLAMGKVGRRPGQAGMVAFGDITTSRSKDTGEPRGTVLSCF